MKKAFLLFFVLLICFPTIPQSNIDKKSGNISTWLRKKSLSQTKPNLPPDYKTISFSYDPFFELLAHNLQDGDEFMSINVYYDENNNQYALSTDSNYQEINEKLISPLFSSISCIIEAGTEVYGL